jgi:hypothetical protein
MSSSPLTTSIASISRLTANVLELLIASPSSSRLNEGMDAISQTLDALRDLAKQVERDWIAYVPLGEFHGSRYWYIPSIFHGSYLRSPCAISAQDSKEITKSIWTMLKTLLFSNIMLAETVLSASVYLHPGSSQIIPASLALQTLHILFHSFRNLEVSPQLLKGLNASQRRSI